MGSLCIATFFNKLYDETYNKISIYVTSKCGCVSDIDDIVQEIYMDIYSTIAKKGVAYIKHPEAFVMKVCKSKIYKYYTIGQKMDAVLSIFPRNNHRDEYDILELEALNYSLEDEVINRQLSKEIWELLCSKDDDIQKIFRLYYTHDLTIPKIAKLLSMSESNVKNKLYRTLKEIRMQYREGV